MIANVPTPHAWEVRQGDALDGLRTLDAGSVAAVITDPPYASGGHTEAARMRGRSMLASVSDQEWFSGDAMGTQGLTWLLRAIAVEAERVLVPGGSLIVFCDWRMWSAIVPAMESAGLRLQAMVVWDKGSAAMGEGFRPTHELAAELRKAGGKARIGGGSNVLRHPRVHGPNKVHPTEKPVELMADLIRVAAPHGGLVVDPFCGSGSTGVAARQLGRRFIGFERSEQFAALARSRIDGTREQLEIDAPTNPKQEVLL